MSFGYNGWDEEFQRQFQQYLAEHGGEQSQSEQPQTVRGLLDADGAGAGSGEPAQPQAPSTFQAQTFEDDSQVLEGDSRTREGGFQAQAPNAPVAPEAPQAEGMPGVVQPTTSAADIAKEAAEAGEGSRLPNTGMLERLNNNAQEALAQAGQKKGGGLLGTLLKIGINTAMGNWLGAVGGKALGTVGDAFNKAFKIKGIGVK